MSTSNRATGNMTADRLRAEAIPDNPAGYVCLTFDFDGPSLWVARRQTTPAPISRGEFGAVAVPRILKLLARHDIACTFFVPGHSIDTYPDVARMIVDAGCEVGLHGYAHEYGPRLSEEQERSILERTHAQVESLTGAPPKGYRAPSGDINPWTAGLLTDFGLSYDSSLMGHDYAPYWLRSGDRFPTDGPMEFGAPVDLVELPFSWHLDDYVHLEFVTFKNMILPGLQNPAAMFDSFLSDVRWMTEHVRHGVCTVTFHPQAIGRGGRLYEMERWIEQVTALGVSYTRMCDVAEAWRAGRELGTD
ncbi:polysaccharide deacetylase family protein [Candidatus Poriferisodalis sp.]|uniref:polysaccharide deacetylase family protein n=1 Tax=Candidatus Poriferisodalis sp. TaxID=3101277 RepID=UPI003B018073